MKYNFDLYENVVTALQLTVRTDISSPNAMCAFTSLDPLLFKLSSSNDHCDTLMPISDADRHHLKTVGTHFEQF